MSWVVDTCLLIDIADADPTFASASAALLDAKRPDGLAISPVTYVKLAPVFDGDAARLELFLYHLDVTPDEDWSQPETSAAFAAWHRCVQARRLQRIAKRPIADILIGAFAEQHDGLLTRNESDFRSHFPALNIITP